MNSITLCNIIYYGWFHSLFKLTIELDLYIHYLVSVLNHNVCCHLGMFCICYVHIYLAILHHIPSDLLSACSHNYGIGVVPSFESQPIMDHTHQ